MQPKKKKKRVSFINIIWIMHRILRAPAVKRVANYNLLRRSITSTVKEAPIVRHHYQAATSATAATTKNLMVRRLTLMNSRRFASTTTKDLSYRETPFLSWKLFPDFEHLVTQTSPAIAVPAFEKLIAAAREEFLEIEKNFEPTWDGTIGKCK